MIQKINISYLLNSIQKRKKFKNNSMEWQNYVHDVDTPSKLLVVLNLHGNVCLSANRCHYKEPLNLVGSKVKAELAIPREIYNICFCVTRI